MVTRTGAAGLTVATFVALLTSCSGSPPAPPQRTAAATASGGGTIAATEPPTPAPLPAAVTATGGIALGGEPSQMVLAGGDLYALGISPQQGGAPSGTVVRVDVGRRREVARTVLPRAALAGSISSRGLYVVLEDADTNAPAAASLLRLDASTLAVLARTQLDNPQPSVVARPDGVYVVDGPRLELRDPSTLALLKTVAIPTRTGEVCHPPGPLAADPRTDRGWIAISLPGGGFQVAEVALSRMSLIHVSEPMGGVCGATVSATLDGVWAGYPTGLMSSASRYGAASGEADAKLQVGAAGWFPEPNSAAYEVSGRALWVYGGLSVSCADLHTGQVRASSDLAQGYGGIAMSADDQHVFVGRSQGISVLSPTPACAL